MLCVLNNQACQLPVFTISSPTLKLRLSSHSSSRVTQRIKAPLLIWFSHLCDNWRERPQVRARYRVPRGAETKTRGAGLKIARRAEHKGTYIRPGHILTNGGTTEWSVIVRQRETSGAAEHRPDRNITPRCSAFSTSQTVNNT